MCVFDDGAIDPLVTALLESICDVYECVVLQAAPLGFYGKIEMFNISHHFCHLLYYLSNPNAYTC